MTTSSVAPAPLVNTSTFQAGDTASGTAAKLGMSPAQFLSYNPDLKAAGHANDYQGLTGVIQPGQAYNTGPAKSVLVQDSGPSRQQEAKNTSSLNTALNSLGTSN